MTVSARLSPLAFALPALAAATVAFAPSSASAQGCTGAPGASAIQQYCEAVPSADGGSDRPGGSGSGSGSGAGSGSGSGVSQSTAKSLSQAGADGAAVERLAGGTKKTAAKATPKPKQKTGSTGAGGSSTDDGAVLAERVDGPADPDGSPLKAATNAVANGPTAGAPLVWGIAGLSIVGVGAAVFFRRRGDSLVIPDDEA